MRLLIIDTNPAPYLEMRCSECGISEYSEPELAALVEVGDVDIHGQQLLLCRACLAEAKVLIDRGQI